MNLGAGSRLSSRWNRGGVLAVALGAYPLGLGLAGTVFPAFSVGVWDSGIRYTAGTFALAVALVTFWVKRWNRTALADRWVWTLAPLLGLSVLAFFPDSEAPVEFRGERGFGLLLLGAVSSFSWFVAHLAFANAAYPSRLDRG